MQLINMTTFLDMKNTEQIAENLVQDILVNSTATKLTENVIDDAIVELEEEILSMTSSSNTYSYNLQDLHHENDIEKNYTKTCNNSYPDLQQTPISCQKNTTDNLNSDLQVNISKNFTQIEQQNKQSLNNNNILQNSSNIVFDDDKKSLNFENARDSANHFSTLDLKSQGEESSSEEKLESHTDR